MECFEAIRWVDIKKEGKTGFLDAKSIVRETYEESGYFCLRRQCGLWCRG